VGDRLRDVEAADLFGGRGLLVESGLHDPGSAGHRFPVLPDLAAAVEAVLAALLLHYFPPP
jgi:hypothetical protein